MGWKIRVNMCFEVVWTYNSLADFNSQISVGFFPGFQIGHKVGGGKK